MKKMFLTLSLGCMAMVAFSQAKVEVGIKAGANFANAKITKITTLNRSAITSYHFGGYGLIKLANIGIQPEVLFSKQGVSLSTGDIDFSYVNIPLMLKFYLPFGLNVQAGPQLGILTNAKDENGVNIRNVLKGSDYSVALGVGWDFPFGLNLTARYVLGLNKINTSKLSSVVAALPSISEGEIKNRTFQLSIGYALFKQGN